MSDLTPAVVCVLTMGETPQEVTKAEVVSECQT
jgi:hypothetical protein